MKKIFTLFLGLFLIVQFGFSQSYWNNYLINENFNGLTTLPSTLTFVNNTSAWIGRSIGMTVGNDVITFSTGSGGGNRGGEFQFDSIGSGLDTVYVEYDWNTTGSVVTNKNSVGTYLLGSHSESTTPYTDMILAIYLVGDSTSVFHLQNLDIAGGNVWWQGGALIKSGATLEKSDSANKASRTTVSYIAGNIYHIAAQLDFTHKKIISLTITDKNNETNTQTLTDLSFVSNTVRNVYRLGINQSRGSNDGNGSTVGAMANTLDNIQVYKKVKSLGQADVTVNYQDLDGNTVKASRTVANQEVGLNFQLESTDIESFKDASYYYAYDAAETGSKTVEVTSEGATITVKFKKVPLTSGTYNWKGIYSEYWNELDDNFSTDGSNALGYQSGNDISFSDANAPIKEVILNNDFDLDGKNIVIDVPGYVIKNNAGEILTNVGKIQVNASTTLGLSTQSTAEVHLNNDTLTITNAELASKIIAANGTTLTPKYTMNTPIEGDGGTFTLLPAVYNYSSAISKVQTVNYPLQIKGSATKVKISGMPKMYCTLDSLAQLNVTTIAGDSTIFATTANYEFNKVSLGDNVYMSYSEIPADPSKTEPTKVNIGELSGSSSSKILGPNVRYVNYSVGALNTDATFAGELKPMCIDNWGADTYFNIIKVGKGTWTLSGNSPRFFGNVTVSDGTLAINDTLCNATPFMSNDSVMENLINSFTVADTATLKGNGYIGALQTNIYGTLKGSLTFGGNLSLADAYTYGHPATTIINVDGNNIDKVTVKGDLQYGGKLIVNVVGNLPDPGDYTIFEFENFYESGEYGFDTIELPSEDWSYNYETGVLTYNGSTGIPQINANKVVSHIDYFDLTGKQVKNNYKGLVIMKVKYTDGTTDVIKTFNNKSVQ